MPNYRKMYYTLFNKITDIVEELQQVQQEAEELYLESSENEPIWLADRPQFSGTIDIAKRAKDRYNRNVSYFQGNPGKEFASMYKILKKEPLNPTVTRMVVEAPLIARKAEPGQFIIFRAKEDSERVPLTIADYDREAGTVTIIFQIVGGATMELNTLEEGDSLHDFVGPLGTPSHLDGLKKVAVVGGGVGCAIAYPVAKKLHELGAEVHSIVGFRSKDLIILEKEFQAASDKLCMMTDDGSYGEKGLVTAALETLISEGNQYDEVIAIGPLIMMKFVCQVTKKYNIKTVVSMNPIMIDGTGMCGGCRLTVGGETKFACVDGPDFDGHLVDFDEAMHRGTMYRDFEQHAREAACNLFSKEVQ